MSDVEHGGVSVNTRRGGASKFYLVVSVALVLIGALLFGFAVGFPSPSKDPLVKKFNLDPQGPKWALIASIMTLGAAGGALGVGPLSDYIGRKWTITLATVPYIVGGTLLALANSYITVIISRAITGVGVGMFSVLVPMYIGEIAPPSIRGALGSGNQFAVTIGVLVAYLNGFEIVTDESWWQSMGWQIAGAGAFLCLASPILPETPRYLVGKGRVEQARLSLIKLGNDDVEEQIEELQEAQNSNKRAHWTELFRGRVLKLLLIGAGLQLCQQFTGINAVANYVGPIFVQAGFSKDETNLASTIVGGTQVAATLLTIFLADRAGRRVLLMIACVVMCVSHVGLGFYFYSESSKGFIAIICLVAFMIGFSLGMGPLPWVVLAEIFPTHLKGNAMSLATLVNWLSNYTVVQTYPTLQKSMDYGVFFMYGGICILALAFIFFFVPETKGMSLEDFQKQHGVEDEQAMHDPLLENN